MCDFVQIVIVPPEVPGVVVLVIERGVVEMEETIGSQLDGVAQQSEVQVGLSVNIDVSDASSCHLHLSGDVVVQRLALCLAELASNEEVVFIVRL